MGDLNGFKGVILASRGNRNIQTAKALFLETLFPMSSMRRIRKISCMSRNRRFISCEVAPLKISHSKSKNCSKKAADCDDVINHFPLVGLSCLIRTFNDTNGGIPCYSEMK